MTSRAMGLYNINMAKTEVLRLLLAAFPVISLAVVTIRQAENNGSVVYQQFHVNSDIIARYAYTRINSVVLNSAATSKELSFRVQLPETAFISNFTMTINGTTYYGIVKGKEEAQQEFNQRQQAGENVGLTESRGTNLFQIRINTAANSQSTFVLYYEELIVRRLSKYQQIINLNPGSKVQDFRVTVRVIEQQGIILTGASDYVGITHQSPNEVVYSYTPTLDGQTDTDFGLARDMMVEYDINHPSNGAGLIVVNNCYFAQFFSPSGVDPVPVDIVFVIDVSGSMSGNKIAQTREALETIINQLRVTDRFTMVTFESRVATWNNRLVSAPEYRQQGIQFARKLEADGGTNFTGGLQTAISILKTHGNPNYVQLLVMLTDGEPTVGETNPDTIVTLALSALTNTRISLNCLGFGQSLNFLLLQRLALSNNGIAKRIYEDSDAAQQLEGFFEEISSPILHTISINYPESAIETISNTDFPLLFNGSELVIAGKFTTDACNSQEMVNVQVIATGASTSQMTFTAQVDAGGNTMIGDRIPLTERLVAYLTIQQLLDQKKIAESEREANLTASKALELALLYNFVTELTSLIVVADDNFTLDDGPGNDGALEDAAFLGLPAPVGPDLAIQSSGVGGVTAATAHSLGGVIAGSVIVVLFILGCIAIVTGINLTVCFYIAGKSKRQNQAPTVTTENHPILLSSIEDEVDKPSNTPPIVAEKSSEEVKSSNTEAADEKEKEAMAEKEEEEQRYQPQEAIFIAPSKEPEGDIKA